MPGQFDSGRMRQKQRTRALLLDAARRLAAEGRRPGVADAADRAGISRSSAYRYFSTPEALVREATLDALASALDIRVVPEGCSAVEAAEATVAAVLAFVLRHEALFRAYLSEAVKAQDGQPPQRGGRRMAWMAQALAPLRPRLPPAEFDRLVHALSLLTGMETVVVLRDVCGLDAAGIEATARWMAGALVRAALPAD